MERHELQDLLNVAEQCQADEPALMRVIEQLEQRLHERQTPELQYACAYAWYIHPRRISDNVIWGRVDGLLHRVLDAVPDDYLSLLYLGHNHYDRAHYAEAEVYFKRAQRIAPKNYIGLKSLEMVVCCGLMMRRLEAALSALHAFVEEASDRSYAPEDIWPRELAAALEVTHPFAQMSPKEFEEAGRLADRLDELGSLNGWISSLVRNPQFLRHDRTGNKPPS
jgi:tetratricopeptide (TPR) repeat protein